MVVFLPGSCFQLYQLGNHSRVIESYGHFEGQFPIASGQIRLGSWEVGEEGDSFFIIGFNGQMEEGLSGLGVEFVDIRLVGEEQFT